MQWLCPHIRDEQNPGTGHIVPTPRNTGPLEQTSSEEEVRPSFIICVWEGMSSVGHFMVVLGFRFADGSELFRVFVCFLKEGCLRF